MPSDFDGFSVLAAMAARPDLFEAGRADAAKAARVIAVKQIKAPKLALDRMRQVRDALGADAFGQVIDGLKDAEVRTLAKRFDGHNARLGDMSATDARRHLAALGGGLAPAERASKAKAPRAKAAGGGKTAGGGEAAGGGRVNRDGPDTERTLSSAAMAARSPRRKSGA